MNAPADSSSPELSEAEVRAALRLLETLVASPGRLAEIEPGLRRDLVVAAGRLSRPTRAEQIALSRSLKKHEKKANTAHDRAVVERAGLRMERRATVYKPLWVSRPAEDGGDSRELRDARCCYVCKQPYTRVHAFYDSMCGDCGDFNYAKRSQSADLGGRAALVTGGRVKIGYQAALLLLRSGARVIVTTRFPVDAATRYAREPDFHAFADRLSIHGLDLRHAPSVELFARYLCDTEPRLDYLLNNACQTVRRPPGFYAHLLDGEARAGEVPGTLAALLAGHAALCAELGGEAPDAAALLAPASLPGVGIRAAARLSQQRYLDEDFSSGLAAFPQGRLDADLQQVDLRGINSWRLRLADVETPELLEVTLVNAIAPFILNGKLKPLMQKTRTFDQHVVNVSAMEGQFYRTTKTDKHPHTNMAKAALNMMTRTSAPDYVADGIHMNAVDTGWITDEDPAAHAARKAEGGFAPPLDVLDGAARIVDPIFSGANTGTHVWGQFLKDYKPAPW